jgi:hypothetical protein
LTLDAKLGKAVSVCRLKTKSGSTAHIWFFKQWHLAPSVNTRDIAHSRSLPEYNNQTAIFRQLNSWISSGELNTIIAEGCGGDPGSAQSALATQRFNGWDLASLKAQLKSPEYESILTSVPLKLEAKYGNALHVVCGDDESLIKKNALAFSDARGEVGFLTRLEQYKNDPLRAKNYLDGVIELYHLPQSTTIPTAIQRLDQELQKSISETELWIQKRNEHLVEVIVDVLRSEPKTLDIAVIYGGAHAPGVQALLETKGLNCTVVEPVGYEDNESKLLQKLQDLLKQRKPK